MSEQEVARERQEWLCIGFVELVGKKAGIAFCQVNVNDAGDDVLEGTDFYFAENKRTRSAHAGNVYSIEVVPTESGGRTAYFDTLQYERMLSDRSKALKLQAQDRAARAKRASDRVRKQQEKVNLVKETLQPLREAYAATSYENRIALEILVIEYLRGHKIGS